MMMFKIQFYILVVSTNEKKSSFSYLKKATQDAINLKTIIFYNLK